MDLSIHEKNENNIFSNNNKKNIDIENKNKKIKSLIAKIIELRKSKKNIDIELNQKIEKNMNDDDSSFSLKNFRLSAQSTRKDNILSIKEDKNNLINKIKKVYDFLNKPMILNKKKIILFFTIYLIIKKYYLNIKSKKNNNLNKNDNNSEKIINQNNQQIKEKNINPFDTSFSVKSTNKKNDDNIFIF